ncbi:hypothetical protein WMF28_37270 [Sorangium sp. So ce590]|uniref:hypothetical protein n=1 Tax=Sorangium sp. So ce590 TaxID=3133317 RepID=UPI003F5D74F9
MLSVLRASHPGAHALDGAPLPERAERAIREGRAARRREAPSTDRGWASTLSQPFSALSEPSSSINTEGWNPDDPGAYALGESEVPWVEVPDIAEVEGAFDEGRDPYAAYADAVIAALEADVSGRVVVLRADFVANVRAWRANSAALEIALRDRMGVSLAETNAFLKAQNRITGFVRRFMDASDWFEDSPVPADLRAQVDTVLKPRFDALADQMKDSLNQWTGDGLDLEQTQLYQTISAFAGAMSTVGEGFEAYAEVMQTLVHATTRIGVGFVPVVGPALDLCEAVTGKAWCQPSGQELSDEERIFSGLGFGLGAVGPMWRAVKTSSGLRPAAIRVAGEIAEIEEVFAKIVKTNRVRGYEPPRGGHEAQEGGHFREEGGEVPGGRWPIARRGRRRRRARRGRHSEDLAS